MIANQLNPLSKVSLSTDYSSFSNLLPNASSIRFYATRT
jgi:hypothetical protein